MKLKNLLGILVSLGLITWLLWGVDWREASAALTHVRPQYLLVLAAVFFVQVYVRALRWRYLLPPENYGLSSRELFDAIMVGQLANFVLPFRAGEFARPAMLAKTSNVDFGTGLGSVVLERLFDLLAVLITFSAVVREIPGLPLWVAVGAKSLLYGALILAAFFLAAVSFPASSRKFVAVLAAYFPAVIAEPMISFSSGILRAAEVLKNFRQILAVVFFTGLVWLGNFMFFYYSFPALGWESSIFESVALTVIVALSVAAPSAPGFVGVYQTACVAGFVLFERSAANGLAYSIVNHLLQYLLIVVVGVAILYRRGVKLRALR